MIVSYTKRSFGKFALAASAALHGGLIAAAIFLSLPADIAGDVLGLEIVTVSPEAVGIHEPAPPLGPMAASDGDGLAKSPPPARLPAQAPDKPLGKSEPQPAPQNGSTSAAPNHAPSVASAPPATGSVSAAPATGNGVSLLFGNPPAYPPGARREGLQGRVVVRVTLRGEGVPAQLRLMQSSGYPVLDKAALDAVAQWRFRASGTVEIDVPIQFKLEDANR